MHGLCLRSLKPWTLWTAFSLALAALAGPAGGRALADHIRELQKAAVEANDSPAAYWGVDPEVYLGWHDHSNRLIPVYTFGTRGAGAGIDLGGYTGPRSPYRREESLRRLYGRVPSGTLNPEAEYLDQANVADIQRAALAAGRKHIFLVIFDGMDWHNTRAAAIHNLERVAYDAGRGTGLHFLDYTADGTTQFGFMVCAPHNDGTRVDVDRQAVLNPGGHRPGGYNATMGGPNPWTPGSDPLYLIGRAKADSGAPDTGEVAVPDESDGWVPGEHPIPDSAATATSMTAGIKTFNAAINVDVAGQPVPTVAHAAQEKGYAVGVVTSVPVGHATPAAAYAHNVSRRDYQDLTRDLLGRPSISHPEEPLAGVDVLIGGGFGDVRAEDAGQGENFVPGNRWLTDADLEAINARRGGRYTVAIRTAGVNGNERLMAAARESVETGTRLFGFYGVGRYNGHLPFETASGDYRPTWGRERTAEEYSEADLDENPTLAQMTEAALVVLAVNPHGFWLMVEQGDLDWANHDNNLDNAIGAAKSGDAAVKVITDWVERHSNWDESLLIVTSDHGHHLVLERPELLIAPR